jgi:ATP-dependent phosphofructokinase / diphosphate-dependent phosphofructokinase
MRRGKPRNALYGQSGGPTAVINATACGVIEAARRSRGRIGRLYAARNGVLGVLAEDLIDTSRESPAAVRALRHTPGAAFGSCRFKLKGLEEDRERYERLVEVLRAHDIGWFFYNGGNDSADTALKLSQISARMGYPLIALGVPKTIDNDLPQTDCCPGFGSAAKYVATSIREASLDVASMAGTSTRVFVLEVMGRHAGWLTAACGLAARRPGELPLVLVFPELPFDEARFLDSVKRNVEAAGYCVVAVSEGVRDAEGRFLAEAGSVDAFGHMQLGGVGPLLRRLSAARATRAGKARLQTALGSGRLPAACRAPYRLAHRSRAGLCRRRSRGEARPRGAQCGDAGDRARLRAPLSLEHRRSAARRSREPRAAPAARVHQRGRLRHHGSVPPLSRAAHRG